MTCKTAGRLAELDEPGAVGSSPGSWPTRVTWRTPMDASRKRASWGEPRAYFDRMLAEGDQGAGCWLWPYGRNKYGYGTLTVDRKTQLAHRFAFFNVHGHWPLIGRHRCDVPLCFNPSHIEDGTRLDNARDKMERSPRFWYGERSKSAKLTDADVREIRRLIEEGAMTQTAIAARFGVYQSTVCRIKLGHRWARVT